MRVRVDPIQDWWTGRTPRERTLLGVMAALIVAVFGWYGLVAPLKTAAEDARERQAEAARTLAETRAAAARLRPTGRAPAGAEALQATLDEAAAGAALALDRRQVNGRAVTVWADAADARAVMSWLATLERRGVRPDRLSVVRGDAGRVELEAAFSGGGAA